MKVMVMSNGHLVEKDIPNQLESIQREVDGFIERVFLISELTEHRIVTLVNEEGKYRSDAPAQIIIAHGMYIADILVGNVLFAGYDGKSDFCDLTDQQIAIIKNALRKRIAYNGSMVAVIDQ